MCHLASISATSLAVVLMDDEQEAIEVLNIFGHEPENANIYVPAQIRTRLKDGTTKVRTGTVTKAKHPVDKKTPAATS